MNILDIQQRIVEQVHRLSGRKTSAGESIMVCCPFHDDSSPSAGVFVGVGMEIPLGFFNCLGCGVKGHWNTWAPKAGLEAVPEWELRAASELVVGERSSVQDDNGSFRKFRSLKDMMHAVGRPAYFPWFEDKDWRGYNGKLLRDFGAQVCMPPGSRRASLFLAVQNQTLLGRWCRRLFTEAERSNVVPYNARNVGKGNGAARLRHNAQPDPRA